MLPSEAKIYFEQLISSAFTSLWAELSNQNKTFDREEISKGRGLGGAGWAARLYSATYRANLFARSDAIVEAIKKTHRDFNSPMEQDVDTQLLDWGRSAMSSMCQALEDSYRRHLQRYATQADEQNARQIHYAVLEASTSNAISRYMWQLRNVPSLNPRKPMAENQNFNALINNVILQSGSNSTANMQQQYAGIDISELKKAISALKEEVSRNQDITAEQRHIATTIAEDASAELSNPSPDKAKLRSILEGIGGFASAIAGIKAAYDAVMSFL